MSEHTSTKAPPSRRRAPTSVAGYHLLRPLEGSHATWEVANDDPKRIELLVLGRARKGQERAARTAFHRQLRARGSLLHPHLAAIVDGGESPRGPYVVVSLPRSRPLSSVIAEGPLAPERTHALLTGVADALDAAHTRWLIHTDLTPRAIFVEPGPRDWAFLTDFGIAHNRPPLAFARAGYRSPEELRGEPPLPESNVYSLACIVYTCLSGSAPFARASSRAAMQAQLGEQPPRLTEARPELPPAIDEVLSSALAKTPGERQKSAGALMREVGEALGVVKSDPETNGRNGTGRFRRRAGAEPARAPKREAVAVTLPRRSPPASRHAASASVSTGVARPKPAPAPPSRPPRRTAIAIETLPPKKRVRRRAAPAGLLVTVLVLTVAAAGVAGWTVGSAGSKADPKAEAAAKAARAKQRAANAGIQAATAKEQQRVGFLGSFNDAVESLNARRAANRRSLARARTPGDQAARAGRLSDSYASARLALAKAPDSVPRAALGSALRRAESAYGRLARSARHGNRSAYRRAVASVRAAERDVDKALEGLGAPA